MAQVEVTVDLWVRCKCGFVIAVRSATGVLPNGRTETYVDHAARCFEFRATSLNTLDGMLVELA